MVDVIPVEFVGGDFRLRGRCEMFGGSDGRGHEGGGEMAWGNVFV